MLRKTNQDFLKNLQVFPSKRRKGRRELSDDQENEDFFSLFPLNFTILHAKMQTLFQSFSR